MLQLKNITDRQKWDDFISSQKEKTFLQAFAWGEFQEKMGNSILRLGVFKNDELGAVALVSKIKARRGKILLIQHGPVVSENADRKELLSFFIDELKNIGKKEGFDLIRMNPLLERNEDNKKMYKELGLKESPMHANAYESTWKLNIIFPKEEILGAMRKTTRYLIRQSLKNKDIIIEKSDNLKEYQRLNEEVAKRQKFIPFSLEYIKNEYEVFSKENHSVIFFGKYKGEVVAAALVIYWGGVGFYHQAASLSKFQKLSIPYLLQWEAIKEAKDRGCTNYDFWGYIDPKKHPNHPWAGPTLFKMGFGGKSSEYMKTHDFPLSKKYYLINIFERLRKIKRGL